MFSKELFRTLILLVFLVLCSDGERLGGNVRSRIGIKIYLYLNLDSSKYSSNESVSDPITTITGSTLILLSCVSGMIWKICRCFRKAQRRERIQEQMNYLDFIHENNFQIFTIHQLNETHVRERG
jgi:hypothetical protein